MTTAVRITDPMTDLAETNKRLRTLVRHQKQYHADCDEMASQREAELAEAQGRLDAANRIIAEQNRAIAQAFTALTIADAYMPNHPEIGRAMEMLRGRGA